MSGCPECGSAPATMTGFTFTCGSYITMGGLSQSEACLGFVNQKKQQVTKIEERPKKSNNMDMLPLLKWKLNQLKEIDSILSDPNSSGAMAGVKIRKMAENTAYMIYELENQK